MLLLYRHTAPGARDPRSFLVAPHRPARCGATCGDMFAQQHTCGARRGGATTLQRAPSRRTGNAHCSRSAQGCCGVRRGGAPRFFSSIFLTFSRFLVTFSRHFFSSLFPTFSRHFFSSLFHPLSRHFFSLFLITFSHFSSIFLTFSRRFFSLFPVAFSHFVPSYF